MLTFVVSDYVHHLDEQYSQYVQQAYASSTAKNFYTSWTLYIQFTIDYGLQLFPPSYDTLSRYLTHVLTQKTYVHSSYLNLKSSLRTFYSCYGYDVDMNDIRIKLLSMASRRTGSHNLSQKSPITPQHLLAMKSGTDANDPVQLTIYVATLIGFFAALRKSNIAPPTPHQYDPSKHLSRQDILVTQDGLIVKLSWTKTLQDNSSVFDVPIAYPPQGSPLDPVSTFIAYNERYPVKPSDPAFSFYVGHKLYVLSQSFLNKCIKDLVQQCGEDPKNFSCHSLRRGSASLMSHSGVETDLIKSHGTWRSAAYQRYIDFSLPQKFSVTKFMHYHINNMDQ